MNMLLNIIPVRTVSNLAMLTVGEALSVVHFIAFGDPSNV